jgi:hypothetical protein
VSDRGIGEVERIRRCRREEEEEVVVVGFI